MGVPFFSQLETFRKRSCLKSVGPHVIQNLSPNKPPPKHRKKFGGTGHNSPPRKPVQSIRRTNGASHRRQALHSQLLGTQAVERCSLIKQIGGKFMDFKSDTNRWAGIGLPNALVKRRTVQRAWDAHRAQIIATCRVLRSVNEQRPGGAI